MAEIHVQATPCTPNDGLASDENEYDLFDRRSIQSSSILAFVALWDPEKGIIVLSALDSVEDGDLSESNPTALYHFPKASISDVESFNFYQPVLPNTASCRSSGCYQALQSRHNTLFSGVEIPELQRGRGASQTSSTLGGLDVYLKGAALSTTHRHQPIYSFLNLNTDFRFPDDSEEAGVVAGCFLGSALNIERYLKNGPMDKLADSWTTLDNTVVENLKIADSSNAKPRNGRRLQKKRKPVPAYMDTVSDSTPPNLCQALHPRKLLRALGCKQKPARDDYDWVVINTVEVS